MVFIFTVKTKLYISLYHCITVSHNYITGSNDANDSNCTDNEACSTCYIFFLELSL